jgi:TolB-like protein/tetratricopeptide (TPR) repeat protein
VYNKFKSLRKKILIIFVCAAAVSLAGASSKDKKIHILVYPFENTGSGQYSWISRGMTESVISDLTKISSIAVFTEDDRKKAVKEIELGMTGLIKESDVVQVGSIMGAHLIFSGSYTVSGNKIRVTAKLISIEKGTVEKSVKVDGTTDRIFDLQYSIVSSLIAAAEQVKIPDTRKPVFTQKDKENIRKIPRMDPKAFELYSKGIEAYETDPKASLNFFAQALAFDKDQYHVNIALAGILSLTGDLDTAAKFYSHAEELLKGYGLENSVEAASLQYSIGMNCWNRGDNAGVIKHTEKAYRILEKSGEENSRLAAAVLMLSGGAYRNMNRLKDAENNTQVSIQIYKSLGMQKTGDYAWGLNNLGVIYSMKKERDRAIEQYFAAMDIWNGLGMKESMGIAYTNCQIGYELHLKGEHKQALVFLLSGKAMCDRLKLNNSFNYAYYMWYTALVYSEGLNDPCEGAKHLKLTVDIFKKHKNEILGQAEKALASMDSACKARTGK